MTTLFCFSSGNQSVYVRHTYILAKSAENDSGRVIINTKVYVLSRDHSLFSVEVVSPSIQDTYTYWLTQIKSVNIRHIYILANSAEKREWSSDTH